jgi:hypothetical protein
MNFDFEPVYAHHDLLIEMGRVELAMENLKERAGEESSTLLPRLVSRMNDLREALDHLPDPDPRAGSMLQHVGDDLAQVA